MVTSLGTSTNTMPASSIAIESCAQPVSIVRSRLCAAVVCKKIRRGGQGARGSAMTYQDSDSELGSSGFKPIVGQRDQREVTALHRDRCFWGWAPRVVPPMHCCIPPLPRLRSCRITRALLMVVNFCKGNSSTCDELRSHVPHAGAEKRCFDELKAAADQQRREGGGSLWSYEDAKALAHTHWKGWCDMAIDKAAHTEEARSERTVTSCR